MPLSDFIKVVSKSLSKSDSLFGFLKKFSTREYTVIPSSSLLLAEVIYMIVYIWSNLFLLKFYNKSFDYPKPTYFQKSFSLLLSITFTTSAAPSKRILIFTEFSHDLRPRKVQLYFTNQLSTDIVILSSIWL